MEIIFLHSLLVTWYKVRFKNQNEEYIDELPDEPKIVYREGKQKH
jgi:hypothetical protein